MTILSIPIQRSQNEKGQTCVTIPWKASKWISQPAYDGRTPFEVQVANDAVIFNTYEVERHLADDSAPEWGPDLDPSPRRMVREGAGEYEGAGHQMVIEHRLDRHGRYQVPLSMEIKEGHQYRKACWKDEKMVEYVEVTTYGDVHTAFELQVNTGNDTLTWCNPEIKADESPTRPGYKLF